MRHVRSPALLLTGLVAGILLAPQLPKIQTKVSEVVGRVRAGKRNSSASASSAPLARPATVPAPNPVDPRLPIERKAEA